jgi:predicted dehydrogenase
MKKNIGIIGYSEIAKRRIIPGLLSSKNFCLKVIGSRNVQIPYFENSIKFCSYTDVFESEEIDTIYVSSPPSLHFEHAKLALSNGKNVIIEKPIVLHSKDLEILFVLANSKKLSLTEALSFEFNPILEELTKLFNDHRKDIVEVNLTFRFPSLPNNNIRNNFGLGGGITNDALIYPLVLLQYFGEDILNLIDFLRLKKYNEFNVDSAMYFSFNSKGIFFQIMVGMGFPYKNSIEILTKDHIFFVPKLFSLKPEEDGIILKDDVVYKRINSLDQVTSMFDFFYNNVLDFNYFQRMKERVLVLEKLGSI